MRDVYCPKAGCGEPCENDYLHDVAADKGLTYTEVLRDFQQRGCEAIDATHSTGNDPFKSEVMSAMFDLLGDDVDGAINMMEDFGF